MSAIQEFSEMASYVEEFGTIKTQQFITVQLMTGDQLEVEIEPRMTWSQLYVAIAELLPKDIRPRLFCQMNLLLHGELCWNKRRVDLHSDVSDVYYLLLDPSCYYVEFDQAPCDVWDNRTNSNMECFRVIIHEEESKEEICLGTFVYHPRRQFYLPLEDVEHEWVKNRHEEDELYLWTEPDQPAMDSIGIVDHLMELAEAKLELFQAAMEGMRINMKNEVATFEEKNEVDDSWHACR